MQKKSTAETIAYFHVLSVPEHHELTSNAGNDRTWVWIAFDLSDGQPKAEWVALIHVLHELAVQFKDAFDMAKRDHGRDRGGDQFVSFAFVLCSSCHRSWRKGWS